MDEIKLPVLEKGWDGYKAKPPTQRSVDDLNKFLQSFPDGYRNPDRVGPSVTGGMSATFIDYESGREVFIESRNLVSSCISVLLSYPDPDQAITISVDLHDGVPQVIRNITDHLAGREFKYTGS